ncbi:MAG: GHKL domain-containing protein [Eubacterium sp.]|nr:GHKL domain-containing protein [Eubacterium sp.]
MIGRKNQSNADYEELSRKYDELFAKCEELEFELSEMRVNTDNIEKQEEEIRSLHESMRSIKHDMKNHLMVTLSYLNDGDSEAAKTYISGILNKLNKIHSYIETGNSLLNHILNEKLAEARQHGIDIKAEVENLAFDKMESMDFSALLSNMLDNAIEACMKEETPQLGVRISKQRAYETIVVKNKISGSVLDSNPELVTSKSDSVEHGRGIPQIKGIVEKYSGICDFYEEDGFFTVCAFIPL